MRYARPIALLAAMTLVACQAAGPAPATTPVAATQAPATAAPVPRTLIVVQRGELDTLDVHVTTKPGIFSVLVNVQEGLVARDPKTMQPVPSLATSWTTPDERTWVFTLRSGVTFHNGEKFDAQVVKYNFDRILKPELKSPLGNTLSTVLDKVEAVDASTVRIATKTPAPWFLERLMRMYFVPPKETAEKGDQHVARNPVGTGPYRFVEWKTGQSVTVERHEGYWGAKPAYQQVVFRQILEASTAIAELLAGSADIVESVPPDQTQAITAAGAEVIAVPSSTVYEVAMDALGRSGKNPFTDVRVRQAANLAVDREKIAKTIFGGVVRPVAGFLPSTVFGHDASLKPYPFDQAKAKQLLAEAGHPNGFDTQMTIFPLPGTTAKDLAEAITADLAKVGIRAMIRQISSNEASPLLRSGQIGAIWIRPNSCASAFDAHLCFSFMTKDAAIVNFSSDTLEQLRVKAGAAVDRGDRLRLYAQAQQHVFDQAPMIFGWPGSIIAAVGKKVSWTPTPDDVTRAFLAKPK